MDAAWCCRPLLGRSAMFDSLGTRSTHIIAWSISELWWNNWMMHINDCESLKVLMHEYLRDSLSTKKMTRRLCKADLKAILATNIAKASAWAITCAPHCSQKSVRCWGISPPKTSRFEETSSTMTTPYVDTPPSKAASVKISTGFRSPRTSTVRPRKFARHARLKSHAWHTWWRLHRLPAEKADANTRQANLTEWPTAKLAFSYRNQILYTTPYKNTLALSY